MAGHMVAPVPRPTRLGALRRVCSSREGSNRTETTDRGEFELPQVQRDRFLDGLPVAHQLHRIVDQVLQPVQRRFDPNEGLVLRSQLLLYPAEPSIGHIGGRSEILREECRQRLESLAADVRELPGPAAALLVVIAGESTSSARSTTPLLNRRDRERGHPVRRSSPEAARTRQRLPNSRVRLVTG